MKLDVLRMGYAAATVWAIAVFLTGVANLVWPDYAVGFLKIIDSIYPGYHLGEWGIWGVLVALLYSFIDAWIMGVLFALFYNLYTKKRT